jgi:hypothetical protein
MSACDWCGTESDTLVPMRIDTGESFWGDYRDEEWCPACCADLMVEESIGADPTEYLGDVR